MERERKGKGQERGQGWCTTEGEGKCRGRWTKETFTQHTYTCTHVYTHARPHIRTHTHARTHTNTFTHTCVHTHTHTHTHIHMPETYKQSCYCTRVEFRYSIFSLSSGDLALGYGRPTITTHLQWNQDSSNHGKADPTPRNKPLYSDRTYKVHQSTNSATMMILNHAENMRTIG